MNTVAATESRYLTRYLIVRGGSRIGDLSIYTIILMVKGMEWLMFAFVISSLFNYLTDFFGQKFYTFRNRLVISRALLREFGRYMLVRVTNIALAFGLYYVLHKVLLVPLVLTFLIVGATFLTIVFLFYRSLFLGSNADLQEEITKWRRSLPGIIRANILETFLYVLMAVLGIVLVCLLIAFFHSLGSHSSECNNHRPVCIHKVRRI